MYNSKDLEGTNLLKLTYNQESTKWLIHLNENKSQKQNKIYNTVSKHRCLELPLNPVYLNYKGPEINEA